MSSLNVSVGVWHDYSKDSLSSLTLTIPKQWGTYLLAALTMLLSLAGASLWTILSYTLHQTRVQHHKRVDVLELQIQTLLRNSGSPTIAVKDALALASAWSGTAGRTKRRLSPIIMAALVLTLIAKVGTILIVGAVTSNDSVLVLANPSGCGSWTFNWTNLYSPAQTSSNNLEAMALTVNSTLSSRQYAKWFYSDITTLAVPVSILPSQRLPYNSSFVPCPFKDANRCISNDTSSPDIALQLDTGLIDSHSHLGINAPLEDRLQFRRLLTCSPINTTDLVTTFTGLNGDIFINVSRLVPQSPPIPLSKNWKSEKNGYVAGYVLACFVLAVKNVMIANSS
jgi:hypothetical protein